MLRPLFRPVKPYILNQRFAENSACVDLKTGRKVIVCNGLKPPVGFKSLYGPAGHKGIDIRAKHGQPVYCALDGTVVDIDTQPKSGLDVKIVSLWNGRKLKHIYEHLLGYQPRKGDFVPAGALVGWADNTGYSAGDHLHFQLEEEINGKWVPIDPDVLMSEFHAQDISSIREQIARITEWITDLLRKSPSKM